MEDQDTPARLVQAAIKLFSEHGFEGTSVKQISDDAGVNVSLVSYHFKGKEGLYRSCFEHFKNGSFLSSLNILQNVASKEELKIRLNLFVEQFWTAYIEERPIMRMIHREEESGFAIARDIIFEIFTGFSERFSGVLEDAQEKGFIRKDLEVKMLVAIFLGALAHNASKDKMCSEFFDCSLSNADYRKKLASTLDTSCFHYGHHYPGRSHAAGNR
jgi:AcrR family transcriptional regulator